MPASRLGELCLAAGTSKSRPSASRSWMQESTASQLGRYLQGSAALATSSPKDHWNVNLDVRCKRGIGGASILQFMVCATRQCTRNNLRPVALVQIVQSRQEK